jgi:hypothetical protein
MGGLWIYYLLSLKFSVGVWKIGFIQLQGTSKKCFWLPRIHNYNLNGNWAKGEYTLWSALKRMVVVTRERRPKCPAKKALGDLHCYHWKP